jgi:hypothetical protein
MRHRLLFATFATLAVLALVARFWTATSFAQDKPTRASFMRQKLEFSKKVLEGLCLEDYDAIVKNARALKVLSMAAEWEVPTIPNADEYIALTTEFQRAAEDLRRNAQEKKIEGATLAYLRMTMNCVNCHRFVRPPK